MKTVRITYQFTMTDELYEEEFAELKDEILCGKNQKDLKDSTASYRRGMIKIKATFELIKDNPSLQFPK